MKVFYSVLYLLIHTSVFANVSPLVFNGQDATLSDDVSKYVVALQMPNFENGEVRYYKGTAFVVGPDLLMTAAHNLFYLNDKMTVETILDLEPKYGVGDGSQTRIAIAGYRIHPDFLSDNTGTYNDIAIIKLKRPLPSFYKSLQFKWNADVSIFAGQAITVAGFGITTDFNQPDSKPKRLRFSSVPFIGGNGDTIISSDKVLVDQSKSGFCAGDSGGPLLANIGGEVTPIGIIVHIFQNQDGNWSCATRGAATRISYFKKWIEEAIVELSK
jgi:secreted trypsin-like serine protease